MKANHKKVLILMSNNGGGHISSSEAIKQIIIKHSPKTEVKIVNMTPAISPVIYRFASNYLPQILIDNWKRLNNPQAAKILHLINTPIIAAKLIPLLLNFRPDLIIATHAFSTEEVAFTLKQLQLSLPHLVVLVDPFSIHHAWTSYHQATLYLLPNRHAASIFIKRGIAKNKIKIVGHPIRPIPPRLRPLPLPSRKFTIFLGGSGEGVGQLDQLVIKLLKQPIVLKKAQLIVAAGKNKTLLLNLKQLQTKYPRIIFPFGFTKNIYSLIKASDIVVSKPGPNLMFETLSLGKPIIATGLPLGQEEGNYQFINNNHLGFLAPDHQQIIKLLVKLIKSPRLLSQFSASIKKQQLIYQDTPQKTWQALKPFL